MNMTYVSLSWVLILFNMISPSFQWLWGRCHEPLDNFFFTNAPTDLGVCQGLPTMVWVQERCDGTRALLHLFEAQCTSAHHVWSQGLISLRQCIMYFEAYSNSMRYFKDRYFTVTPLNKEVHVKICKIIVKLPYTCMDIFSNFWHHSHFFVESKFYVYSMSGKRTCRLHLGSPRKKYGGASIIEGMNIKHWPILQKK